MALNCVERQAPPGGMKFAPDNLTSLVHGAVMLYDRNFHAENTNRAAALKTNCSLSIR